MNTFTNSPGLRTTVATSAGLTIGATSFVALHALSTYGLVATVLCVVCTTLTVRHALGDATRFGQRLVLGTLLPPVLVFVPLLWGAFIAFFAGLLALVALLGLCHALFAATRRPAYAQAKVLLVLAAWSAVMAGFAWALVPLVRAAPTLAPALQGLIALFALAMALASPRPSSAGPIQN